MLQDEKRAKRIYLLHQNSETYLRAAAYPGQAIEALEQTLQKNGYKLILIATESINPIELLVVIDGKYYMSNNM